LPPLTLAVIPHWPQWQSSVRPIITSPLEAEQDSAEFTPPISALNSRQSAIIVA
jgi:hypothetical protein